MKPALLLVDLQPDYLNADGLQPSAEILVARTAALLAACRERRVPVVHIWTTIHRAPDRRLPHWKRANRWLCVPGTDGHRTPDPLQPRDGEVVVHKTGFNAFAGPELDAALQRFGCDFILLAGVHLHTCVRTAAAECLERNLDVNICADAVGSNDPVYAAPTQRWLAERGVRFEPAQALLRLLDGAALPALVHRSPLDTGKALFTVPMATGDEVAQATGQAQTAWQAWRRTSIRERCQPLELAAARLESAGPELARQMAIEIGKPVTHGLEEIRRAAGNIRDVIRRAVHFEFRKREATGLTRHEPLGVIALISPWNNPVAIPAGKIAPALLCGNTVVWKPAPAATSLSRFLLQLFHDAGVPRDAVQLLPGDHVTAQRLAASDPIAAVTLTGGAPAGFAIQEICARRFVPLQAELGGNNAVIVWDDADLPQAAAQIARGAFGFAGQRCTANRRVIVPAARWESYLDALQAAAERLAWGDPLDTATDIGPVIDTAKRDEHMALIERARNSGAAHCVQWLHRSSAGQPWLNGGAYAQPAIVGCDLPSHPLVQEETMSPLLVLQRARDFEHALALCNGVRHGLAAALFSRSPALQNQFLSETRAGLLKLNASTAGVDSSLPFGGWKASGLGPAEHGESDPLFYTRIQTVYG